MPSTVIVSFDSASVMPLAVALTIFGDVSSVRGMDYRFAQLERASYTAYDVRAGSMWR